ncbi:MAG: hypothetical protein ACTSRG_08790 [Candidatus Helarchaeota archaeon]
MMKKIAKSPKKGLKNYTKEELDLIRKKKLKMEILSAKKLLKHKKPLEIADGFIHEIIKLMENSLIKENPTLDQEEFRKRMIDRLSISKKVKELRKRGRNLWQR